MLESHYSTEYIFSSVNLIMFLSKALESSRNTLLEHLKEIYPKTHGIVFLGTPHRGSNTASLGSIAASVIKAVGHDENTSIVRSLEVNSETLDKISDAFSRSLALQEIRAYSFREELGMTNIKGVRMVCLVLAAPTYPFPMYLLSTGGRTIFSRDWGC